MRSTICVRRNDLSNMVSREPRGNDIQQFSGERIKQAFFERSQKIIVVEECFKRIESSTTNIFSLEDIIQGM